jgi:hypothetical protein
MHFAVHWQCSRLYGVDNRGQGAFTWLKIGTCLQNTCNGFGFSNAGFFTTCLLTHLFVCKEMCIVLEKPLNNSLCHIRQQILIIDSLSNSTEQDLEKSRPNPDPATPHKTVFSEDENTHCYNCFYSDHRNLAKIVNLSALNANVFLTRPSFTEKQALRDLFNFVCAGIITSVLLWFTKTWRCALNREISLQSMQNFSVIRKFRYLKSKSATCFLELLKGRHSFAPPP